MSGGILKLVDDLYKLSQIRYTVSCTELVEKHGPTVDPEMESLIEVHKNPCVTCNARTKNGGLEGWSWMLLRRCLDVLEKGCLIKSDNPVIRERVRKLNARRNELRDISWQQCHDFWYAFYITNTVKGKGMEAAAIAELSKTLGADGIRPATEYEDRDYSVDIVLREVCGIQVKPESYKRCDGEVHAENLRRNARWGKPVVYLYYRRDKFLNMRDVASATAAHLGLPDPFQSRKRSFAELRRVALG